MITETRQSRTRLLQYYECRTRPPRRRRHHTLDNATLDKFNFICIPLHLDEGSGQSSSSQQQSNVTVTSSRDILLTKPTELSSPTRRVRFKFDNHDKNIDNHIYSSDNDQLSKKHSVHRVEFQIPIHRDINPWLNVDCLSTPAKTRSITSQKIDINYTKKNTTYPYNMTSYIDSAIPPTDDSDKTRTQWYKEMYCQIHKSPEHKKDVILVKLPFTPSRYREYNQQKDEQPNPYKPTYTFPEQFNGDFDHLEDYIRKTASTKVDNNISSSPVRTSTANMNDHQTISKRNQEKTIRFNDHVTTSVIPSPPLVERTKSTIDTPALPITTNSRSNTNHPIQTSPPPPPHPPPTTTTSSSSSSTDDEQKLIYKRVLRGGDIPSAGLQRHIINNRVASSSIQRPLNLTNHLQSSPKLFAYYSVHWEQNQTNQLHDLIDHDVHFEINSCLYFQNKNDDDNNIDNNDDDDDDDDEWEQIHEDGCGYVITYPPHIHPTDNLQIYNFDRKKKFLLTSNDVYLNTYISMRMCQINGE
ncbi:unnamed protein product [Adineta steineri]|uniref:Uncharacterized protein n=1 Tax=Adineta steineri TaxID=433720 RepID=A0A814V1K4_9BILA|nr:unnamed protein product [Adineta steineri]